MNIPTQAISDIVVGLFPVLALIAGLIYQFTIQKLPANVRTTVAHVAQIAVQKTEQISAAASGDAKKALAVDLVGQMLAELKMPVPTKLIDGAIESAVYLMNQAQANQPGAATSAGPSPLTPGAPHA